MTEQAAARDTDSMLADSARMHKEMELAEIGFSGDLLELLTDTYMAGWCDAFGQARRLLDAAFEGD